SLGEVVDALQGAGRQEAPRLIEGWLNALEPKGRWALLKLVTGGLRVGVSARLARTAAAMMRPDAVSAPPTPEGGEQAAVLPPVDVADVEEVGPGLSPPYGDLFAWLEARGERTSAEASRASRRA